MVPETPENTGVYGAICPSTDSTDVLTVLLYWYTVELGTHGAKTHSSGRTSKVPRIFTLEVLIWNLIFSFALANSWKIHKITGGSWNQEFFVLAVLYTEWQRL